MGMFFTEGESKIRPGVYSRYEKNVGSNVAGATNGIVAAVFQANWGPLKSVSVLNGIDEVSPLYGKALTTDVLTEVFNGGASEVKAVRLGSGGTNGTATLKDTSTTPAVAINLTTKYPSDRALQIMIRTALGDTSTKEFIVYEDNILLEKLSFPSSANGEVDALLSVGANSQFFVFAKADNYAGNGVVATIAATPITKGTNPSITNAEYSAAFLLLEPYRWNTICVDTIDTSVHALLDAYMTRVYAGGKKGFDVVGEPTSVDIATREAHARAYNNYLTIYVGGGVLTAAGKLEGYQMAARIAGMVAAVPSNQCLTHMAIKGALAPIELLTNAQYEQSIKNGMLTFSASADGTVWVEEGITTLVTPSGEDDEGWKKIKRTKIRLELFQRADDTLEKLIGKVNNDSDGQATVLQNLKGVLNAMIAETKLLPGATVKLSSASADSAYFEFAVDDIDALEKIYLVYKFRYSAAA
jgi:hypothetical protein